MTAIRLSVAMSSKALAPVLTVLTLSMIVMLSLLIIERLTEGDLRGSAIVAVFAALAHDTVHLRPQCYPFAIHSACDHDGIVVVGVVVSGLGIHDLASNEGKRVRASGIMGHGRHGVIVWSVAKTSTDTIRQRGWGRTTGRLSLTGIRDGVGMVTAPMIAYELLIKDFQASGHHCAR